MSEENQRQYEFTFILSPELDEKGVNSFEQEVEKSIKDLGGDLKKKSKPERRNLAYPIKKFQTGYYSVINFLFNPEKLEELSTIFKHRKEILRCIFTIAEEPPVIKKPFNHQRQPIESRLTKDKERIEKFKKLTEEVTEKEIEALKKTAKKSQPATRSPARQAGQPASSAKRGESKDEKKKVKLEEIDKKLDEILGI